MHHTRTTCAFLLLVVLGTAACTRPPSVTPAPTESERSPAASSADGEAVVLAAGDVAACDSDGDEATAELLDELEGTILVLGDLAYPDGDARDFARCYDPSWGRHRDRTRPVPGNHEYDTEDAAPYFDYFGPVAGDPDEGWHSFDLAEWHVIGLNSNCTEVGGCDSDSPQAEWLRDDLASNNADCTLAYWHHPRWSSGEEHGSDDLTDAFWQILHDAGADLVLTGHDHQYERLHAMDAGGDPDPNGLVEFVVGTGGKSLYEFAEILPTSAAHDNSSFGVLRLTLRPDSYEWEFVPTSDTGFEDSGTADCR